MGLSLLVEQMGRRVAAASLLRCCCIVAAALISRKSATVPFTRHPSNGLIEASGADLTAHEGWGRGPGGWGWGRG